jgi:ABC-type transport system involved in multi-copper enzyme maturation permease subunit
MRDREVKQIAKSRPWFGVWARLGCDFRCVRLDLAFRLSRFLYRGDPRYTLDSGRRISASSKQQSVNDLFQLFAVPDLLHIIKVILSLCAMLFAFDMVSGEKEAGTLRQSLSGSMGRPILILGKWIGGFASFILPLFLAVLLGTIFVTLQPTVAMNSQDWARFGLSNLLILVLFNLLFCAAAGMLWRFELVLRMSDAEHGAGRLANDLLRDAAQ